MPSLVGTTVTANYLKAAPSTQFGTRELAIVKIAVDVNLFTSQSASNSLFSQAVRALQQTAEVYAVYAAQDGTPDFFHAIIATDTQTNGDTKPAGGLVDTGTGYGILEAAIVAGVTGASACTITVATLS
jgi:hypothetical protein